MKIWKINIHVHIRFLYIRPRIRPYRTDARTFSTKAVETLSLYYAPLLLAAKAGAFCLSYHAGIHTIDTDVICMAHLIIIERTVCCLAVNLQSGIWFTDCVFTAVAALLLKAGTAGLMRHGGLAAFHKDIIFRAFFVCIIHAVYNITIQSRHDLFPICN